VSGRSSSDKARQLERCDTRAHAVQRVYEFGKVIREELALYAKVIKQANIRVE